MITLVKLWLHFESLQLATRPKDMNVPMSDDFVVHHVLNSLPMEFEQLEMLYNA